MFDSEKFDKSKTRESQSRQSGCHTPAGSNASDTDPDSDATAARREAVAHFASLCRRSRQWIFEGSDLMPVLLTRLPGWRSSRLLLEILEEGHNPVIVCFDEDTHVDRPVITLRRINDNHYRAVVNGAEVELGADGNCFFYAVWYALNNGISEEIREQIYAGSSSRDKFEATDFFRHEIADYALTHEEEVGAMLVDHSQFVAPANEKPDDRKSSATDGQGDNAELGARWSDSVPFALKEIARSIFHSGKALSSALGWSILTTEGLKTLSQWLPLQYLPFRIYFLYDALMNKREYFSAFLNLLILLPYNLLTNDHFLFDVANAARQIYRPLLSGMDDLPPYFWTAVGTLALVAHYAAFARQDVELPQTRIGQAVTALLQQLRHMPQLYGLLETINSATPSPALDEDGKMKMTAAEIRSAREERKTLKAAFLSKAGSSSRPTARPGSFIDTSPEQQPQIQTTRERAEAPVGPATNAPSPGLNLSAPTESTAAATTGPGAIMGSESEPLVLAALEALLDVAHKSKQDAADDSQERPSGQCEEYPASPPEDSVASAAPETGSFITPTKATVAALYVSSPAARRAILAAVGIVVITTVTAYLVQLGLSIPKENDNLDLEILQPNAQPLSQERNYINADMQTPNFKWLYLKNYKLGPVSDWIATELDHELFEDALVSIFEPEDKNSPGESEKAVYETAVRSAFGDYIRDTQIPLRYRSSEDHYGTELYSIIKTSRTPEQKRRLKPVLIKIKAFETFILRERSGLHFDTREGPIAKLESVFGLRIELPEIEISIKTLDEYVNTQLGYKTTTTIPPETWDGVRTAVSIWTNVTQSYLQEKSGIPESAISDSRQIIQDKINKEREELYTLRGPRDRTRREISKRKLAEYRYAAHYLESLITLSHNFLEVLNEIKPTLREIKPQLSTLSQTLGAATVLYARILAIKSALKMFGKQITPAKSDNPSVLQNLSDRDYLNNYPFLVESSAEITAFISLSEAIFYKVLTDLDVENLHQHAKNPTALIFDFKNELDNSPLNRSYESLADEGVKFVKGITTSDKSYDDTEYYRQFSIFKNKYHNPLVKAVSYLSLLEYGMHPYDMLARKPLRVVQLTLYMRAKLPPAPKPSIAYAYLMLMNYISDNSDTKTSYAHAGELIFCEMSPGNWIVISTLGGSTVVRSATARQINQNAALADISREQGCPETDFEDPFMDMFYSDVPSGSHHLWMDKFIITDIVRPIFGNAATIDETSFEKAYLFLNRKSKRNFKNKNILAIVNEATDHSLKNTMEQAKEAKYKRQWWQYYTFLITGFDIAYRSYHDSDYQPSAGEISLEVLSGTLTLLSMGFPAARLTAQSTRLLRESVIKNLAKGLRGPALFTAVLADVGSNLAFLPLRIMAIAGYELLAFWEPLPLDKVFNSIYKNVKKFKFKFEFKKVKAEIIPDITIKKLEQNSPDAINPGKQGADEARGLLIALDPRDVRYYEFSYSYEAETLLGTGRLPEMEPAGPSAPKPPLADVHTLNEEGAIELKSSRSITRIETPFTYSRADATTLPGATSSLGNEGRHLAFDSIEQGIVRDIEFHRQPLAPLTYGGDLGMNTNTEVVQLQELVGSAIGIRIALEDIDQGRPILLTSGEMSGGAFLVGVDEKGGYVYIYRLGDISVSLDDPAVENSVIRRALETHNSLVTRSEMGISIPESVQKSDLLWLSQKFDKFIVIYSDDPRASGFTILDNDFDISAQPGATPLTRHSASSPELDLIRFGRTSGDINIFQSNGNAYYLLSRNANNQVSIIGRAEYRGQVDTSKIKPWQPDAEDGKGSDIVTSDLRQIEDLLVRSGKRVSARIRIPGENTLDAVKGAGLYFSDNGYSVSYRTLVILSPELSDEIILHYAPVVEKDGRTYVIDITAAARFSEQGINDPLYLSDHSWRVQYISMFPDHLILVRDLENFDFLADFAKLDYTRESLIAKISDPTWTLLNKPSWTIHKGSEVIESINTDIIVNIAPGSIQRGYLDVNPSEVRPFLSAERIETWNAIVTDKNFILALNGKPSIVTKNIRAFLLEKNIKSEIIMTKTYDDFHDDNPSTNYAIKAIFDDETTDILALSPDPVGESFSVVYPVPFNQWLNGNKQKITFFRFIDDPDSIPDFLDTDNTPKEIGQSHFFNEVANRYSVMNFDQNAISSLESIITQTRAEMEKFSGPYLGNDLRTERAILDQLHQKQPPDQMEIRVQQTRIDEISKYQFLRGLLGRLEDLRGKIQGGVATDIRPERNPGRRMIGKVSDLQSHTLKNIFFDKFSVKKLDPLTQKYINAPNFVVLKIPDLKNMFGEVELKIILSEYLNLYKEIYDMAISYSVEGRLIRGQGIVKNSRLGIEMIERLIRYSDLHYDDNIYALIDKSSFDFQNPQAYGLSLVLNSFEKDEILHLDTVVEHPFIQLRDEDEFVDYAVRHGAEWDLLTLQAYKTEGIGRFLSYQTAKKSVAKSTAKYISMQVRNSRTENIASALGMREMNDLEFYGLDVSPKAAADAQWSLLRSIFQTISSKAGKKPETKPGPVVDAPESPVLASGSNLNKQWRREDISLDDERPGESGNRFEGIYSVPQMGSSTSPDVWKHYIKEEANVYQVRWDDDALTWLVVDPFDPGVFGSAIPVRLNANGHWETGIEIRVAASSPPSVVGRVGHLVDLSEPESREIRAILASARRRAVNIVEGALKALARGDPDDVDDAMDIFFGRHEKPAKEAYGATLTMIRDFLKNLDVIDDVSYWGGYFDKKMVLMRTVSGSYLTNWKEGPPPILVSVDALADLTSDISFTFSAFKNEVACLLIHEAYHAVSGGAKDLQYVAIAEGAVDISPIIRLRELQWFGDDATIMRTHGISKKQLAEKREQSYRRAIKNPDNLAYLTVTLSHLDDRNPLYGKFITEYDRWIMDQKSALGWKNKGYDKGRPLRLKTRTAMADLIHADTRPLVLNGLLYRTSSSEISVEFDVLASGSSKPEKFSRENPAFSDFLDTWDGSKATSRKNDVWSGTWGSEHFLNKDFSIIEIKGENSVVTAIRIDLRKISEGHPLILSGGELRGSTLAFAFSGEGPDVYLYAFHAGYQVDNPSWQPSQHGVVGIYNAHLAMGGEAIPGLIISDAGVFVDEAGNTVGHSVLNQILGKYRQGAVAYSGQLPDSPPVAAATEPTVEWIDYSAGPPGPGLRGGYAYTLVTMIDGTGHIRFVARPAPLPQPAGGPKPKPPKT